MSRAVVLCNGFGWKKSKGKSGFRGRIAFVVALVAITASAFGAPVSRQQATSFAKDFAYLHGWHLAKAGWTAEDGGEPAVKFNGILTDEADNTIAYKFGLPTGGEVVVVGDDELSPVFFYSETNTFDPKANPTAGYLYEILKARVRCAEVSDGEEASPKWQIFTDRALAYRGKSVSSSDACGGGNYWSADQHSVESERSV